MNQNNENCFKVSEQNAKLVINQFLNKKYSNLLKEKFEIKCKKLTGGNSNVIYKCQIKNLCTNNDLNVVLRFYGSELTGLGNKFKNDDVELLILKELAKNFQIPNVLHTFENGRIEEFFKLRQMTSEEFYDFDVSKKISCLIAQIHSLNMTKIININQNHLEDTIKNLYHNYLMRKKILNFCVIDDENLKRKKFILDFDFNEMVKWILNIKKSLNSRIVFNHNDINRTNFHWYKPNDEDEKMILIDFEYSSYNYRYIDLSNYLIEIAYEKANDFECVFENFPDQIFIENLVESYLFFWKQYTKNSLFDVNIDNNQNLIFEINFGCIIINFIRILWILNHEKINEPEMTLWATAYSRLIFLIELFNSFRKKYST